MVLGPKVPASRPLMTPSLDPIGVGADDVLPMNLARAFLVSLIAVSVAMVPLAGGMARAEADRMSATAMPSDCCPHGKPCEKKTSDDCGSMAGCALKCFNFSGALALGVVVRPVPAADLAPVLASLIFHSNSTVPLLPPPRV